MFINDLNLKVFVIGKVNSCFPTQENERFQNAMNVDKFYFCSFCYLRQELQAKDSLVWVSVSLCDIRQGSQTNSFSDSSKDSLLCFCCYL